MDSNEIKLIIEAVLKDDQFRAGVNGMKKHSEGLFGILKSGWFAVAAATTAAIAGIKKLSQASSESVLAQTNLIQSMKNAGTYSDALLKSYNDQAKALQQKTMFEDDDVTAMQAQLAQYGVSGDQLTRLTAATLDYAQAQGIDAVEAGKLVGQSLNGQRNALSRYGVELDRNATQAQKTEQAIAGLNRVFGGRAEAAAMSFAGTMRIFGNNVKDLAEVVGGKINVGLQNIVADMNNFITSGKRAKEIETTFRVIAAAVTILGGVLSSALKLVIDLVSYLVNVLPNAGRLIGDVFTGQWGKIKADAAKVAEDSKQFGRNVGEDMAQTAVITAESVKAIMKGASEQVIAANQNTNNTIIAQDQATLDLQKQMREAAYSAMGTMAQNFGQITAEAMAGYEKSSTDVFKSLITDFANLMAGQLALKGAADILMGNYIMGITEEIGAGAIKGLAAAIVASFDKGTDYVPYDMFAKVHKGERIVPENMNNPTISNATLAGMMMPMAPAMAYAGGGPVNNYNNQTSSITQNITAVGQTVDDLTRYGRRMGVELWRR